MPKGTLQQVIPLYFKTRLCRITLTQLHEAIFSAVLKGTKREVLVAEAGRFLDLFLTKHLHPVILERFLQAKKEGGETFLLSSSPDFLVGPIAELLGFDRWKGTEYDVDFDDRLCKIASLIEGGAKLRLAAEYKREEVIAYSDSEDDLPLLEWAQIAVVVQPRGRLLKLARKRNWEVIL